MPANNNFRQILLMSIVLGLGFLCGMGFQEVRRNIARSNLISVSAQTIKDFAVAVLEYRERTGNYPRERSELTAPSKGGDFSAERWEQIQYFRTNDGFVAFLGLSRVVWIDAEGYVRFE